LLWQNDSQCFHSWQVLWLDRIEELAVTQEAPVEFAPKHRGVDQPGKLVNGPTSAAFHALSEDRTAIQERVRVSHLACIAARHQTFSQPAIKFWVTLATGVLVKWRYQFSP